MKSVSASRAISRSLIRGLLAVSMTVSAITAQADWASWWRTPEQQAKAALEAGDVERLQRIAPDAAWQGIAEHESGDFESAGKTFGDVAQQQLLEGNARAANQALYNRGVSEVRAGQYEQAVQTFDRVLEQDPLFDDALHNRDIARQLIEQQEQEQQQEQQPDQGEGESSEDGEQQQSDESGDQSSESQSDEQGEPGEQSEAEPGESGEQSGDSEGAEEPASQSQQEADEQAAREALEAEAQAANEPDDETDAQGSSATEQEQPMSESDQATEQWLRRIPDDPAGLLRRKLEQSHRTDYPQVRDSREPW